MQLINLFGIGLAVLASTAAAMPRFAGPYHGARVQVHLPSNSTGAHNATTTATRGKAPLGTGLSRAKNGTHALHGANTPERTNHINVNRCHELCSLESQTCSLAVPEDDRFW